MKRFKILGAIISLFLCLSVANTAFAVILSISHIEQETPEWCWAAVAQDINYYYGSYPSQCDIVTGYYYNSRGYYECYYCYDCSGWPLGYFSEMGYILSEMGYMLSWAIIPTSHVGTYLSEAQVATAINAGTPFILQWYMGSTYHIVEGYGYDSGYVAIHDPWPDNDGGGDTYNSYAWVYYGSVYGRTHTWVDTITTGFP